MSRNCGQCTYLDLNSGDIYGKFYCDKKWERHLSTDPVCSSFCEAYSRDYSTIQNAYRYSSDHTSGGCYLTTMLCDILGMPDNNIYLNTMRKFRKEILQQNEKYKTLLVEYDIIGPKIAESLKDDPLSEAIAKNCFKNYILPIVNFINSKEYTVAVNLYIFMTNSLKNLYSLKNISISNSEIDNADIKESGHGFYKLKKLIPNE